MGSGKLERGWSLFLPRSWVDLSSDTSGWLFAWRVLEIVREKGFCIFSSRQPNFTPPPPVSKGCSLITYTYILALVKYWSALWFEQLLLMLNQLFCHKTNWNGSSASLSISLYPWTKGVLKYFMWLDIMTLWMIIWHYLELSFQKIPFY